jgi:hypothetical protein
VTGARHYVACYVVVDDLGGILYNGFCDLTSDPMPLDDPDPAVVGACHGTTAASIRIDCDHKGGVPAGRVVILHLAEVPA